MTALTSTLYAMTLFLSLTSLLHWCHRRHQKTVRSRKRVVSALRNVLKGSETQAGPLAEVR